jgi:hypothetical protein
MGTGARRQGQCGTLLAHLEDSSPSFRISSARDHRPIVDPEHSCSADGTSVHPGWTSLAASPRSPSKSDARRCRPRACSRGTIAYRFRAHAFVTRGLSAGSATPRSAYASKADLFFNQRRRIARTPIRRASRPNAGPRTPPGDRQPDRSATICRSQVSPVEEKTTKNTSTFVLGPMQGGAVVPHGPPHLGGARHDSLPFAPPKSHPALMRASAPDRRLPHEHKPIERSQ